MFAKRLFQKAANRLHHHHHHHTSLNLTAEDLDVRINVHYGIPSTASVLAVDPIQSLLAVGTLDGKVKLIGGNNIEGLLISPKRLPYKFMEFFQNEGLLASITIENDIQVWNLKRMCLACSLQWNSNATAFTIINGSLFMYIGDEYGSLSVLKYDVENEELLQLPYHITSRSLAEVGGYSFLDQQPIVGLLPQPCTSGNRILIAYEFGLLMLWDVLEARMVIVRGDRVLELKDVASHSSSGADADSPHHLEDKEISALCWASSDGSILAVGYIDGDILFWKLPSSGPKKSQEAGLSHVVKLQLSTAEKRLPIVTLHWWANSEPDNNYDGQLLIYGGCDLGSDEAVTVLNLKWSSGMELLKCVNRVDLNLSNSFADVVFLPTAGTRGSNQNSALFVLTNPGQLKVFDCTSMSATGFQQEKRISVSAENFRGLIPAVDPPLTVAKLFQSPANGNSSETLSEMALFKRFCLTATLSDGTKRTLTGGVPNHLCLSKATSTQRVFIAGYQDGSVRIWDATHPVLSLLCILGREVRGTNMVVSSTSVTEVDFCFDTARLAFGDERGLVRLYDLNGNDETSFHFITQTKHEVHEIVQSQGLNCRATIHLLDSQVQSVGFANHGDKLLIGYNCGRVAVLDVNSLSLLFLTNPLSGTTSPLVSVTLKKFICTEGDTKSPKVSKVSDKATEDFMFILTEDSKIYTADGTSGGIISPRPMYLRKESTAISMYVIGYESSKGQAQSSDVVNDKPFNDITAGEFDQCNVENQPLEKVPVKEHLKDSFVLLCCSNALRLYTAESVFHGENKPLCKVKLEKTCCWTTTFMKEHQVSGIVLLFQTGEIQIRSLPELELVNEVSLMSILRWNFDPKMIKALSSTETGLIALVNDSEVAFISVLASQNDFRIPESLPSFHDEVLEAAAKAAIGFLNQKKKQGSGPSILGGIIKGIKGEKLKRPLDLAITSKSNFSHLEDIFMRNPFPDTSTVLRTAELDIDDIEIDETLPSVSSSSLKIPNTETGNRTEREKLFDFDGTDAKPRVRTREEILATYRKTGDVSSVAGQARNKLVERQEKLEKISRRTEELQSGAEDFASLANELVKAMEGQKWWQI